jgi:hypothetical protein
MTLPQADGQDYDRFVALGVECRKGGDAQKWALGELVTHFCEHYGLELKRGRPPKDYQGPTLTGYARDIGEVTARLSECGNTYAFYPENVRGSEDYADLTWRHFNRAREAADGQLDNAMELLDMAARLHLGVDDFSNYLAGNYFAMLVEWHELPERSRPFVPVGRPVWLIGKRPQEGEG